MVSFGENAMQAITCNKVSIRLECNHTIVMADVTKIEYNEHSVTITLTYDNTFMLKREVVLYPESFVTGLAVRVIRCYVSNRYIGYFSCVNGSIKFTQSTTA